jgi:hypothetical protein
LGILWILFDFAQPKLLDEVNLIVFMKILVTIYDEPSIQSMTKKESKVIYVLCLGFVILIFFPLLIVESFSIRPHTVNF